MAAFPCPHQYPHLDTHAFPTYPPSIDMGVASSLQTGEDSSNTASPCLRRYYSPDSSIPTPITSTNYLSSSSFDSVTNASSAYQYCLQIDSPVGSEQMHEENKRRGNQRLGDDSPHSVDLAEGKKRRQQRKCSVTREPKEKDKKGNKNERKVSKDPPSEYIHVRARRGQATDSHSLAERVRREKIRERMKLLQELVPGCDKVTGKALMLDEIINYVQSLQSQVEFLSMKLASVNPIMCDFPFDDCFFEQEAVDGRSPPMATAHQAGHVHPTAFAGAAKNYPLLDNNSCPFLLQGQAAHSRPQDSGDPHIQRNGHEQKLDLQLQFGNISFI